MQQQQGSVLGPTLFVLYAADVIPLIEDCSLSVHVYADDLQVYGHMAATQSAQLLTQMVDCIARVEVWMARNRLCLNSSKTELIWLGSSRRLPQCTPDAMTVSGATIKPSQAVRDLGVIVDGDLSLTVHVSHVTSVCFFHLRQLRLIRRSLTVDTAHVLVRALIHSRLDYCNALLAGLPANQLSRLQSVLRAAARLVLGLPGRASVSAAMRNSLHWLGYPQRVTYKLCLLTYKCLQGWAPAYLTRLCVPTASVAGRSRLRSADDNELVIPSTQTVTLGDRAFSSSGPASWNSLPPALRRQSVSLQCFRHSLKTFLFNV